MQCEGNNLFLTLWLYMFMAILCRFQGDFSLQAVARVSSDFAPGFKLQDKG